MSAIGAIGGSTVSWQQPQDYAHKAAQRTEAVSKAAPVRENSVSAASHAAASAAGSARDFRPVAEMPYIPDGYGPEDLATRTRAEYPELSRQIDPDDEWVQRFGSPFGDDEGAQANVLPGEDAEEPFRTVGTPFGEEKDDMPRLPGQDDGEEDDGVDGVKGKGGAPGVDGTEKCQTCARRKYQDGSDDPGVSFKMPTKVDPSVAHARVRGHEMEHVVRETAKAKKEGRKVVSQTVTYHTAICPECGRVYTSGGTTRTVTAPDRAKDMREKQLEEMEDDFDISA